MTKLAIEGGAAACTRPFPRWPQWGEREETLLMEALADGQWGTLGKKALAFAARYARYAGVSHGIAVNNGTQALELALRALDIGYGDEVVVTAYTFVATVSAIAMVGATPVFADIDPDTGCIDAQSAEAAITSKTRAIVAVHIAGRPCDMDALGALAAKYKLPILEDAAHAHGSMWRGRRCGGLGAIAATSFQSSKILTSGEGGMILTDDEALFREAWHYHNSGRALGGATELGGLVLMGTNGRMAEWEAAVLDAQMDRLDAQNDVREAHARLLDGRLGAMDWLKLPPKDARVTKNGYYLYPLRLCPQALKVGRDQIVAALRAEGVPAGSVYAPLNRMGMLRTDNFRKTTGCLTDYAALALPNAQALSETGVWLNGSALLAEAEDVARIADAFEKVGAAYRV